MSHTRALQDGFPKVSLMNITPLPLLIMTPHKDFDLDSLGTPENCVADFCLIPVYFSSSCDYVFSGSDGTADRDRHGIRVSGGCRSATLDATEQLVVFDAFCGNDGG